MAKKRTFREFKQGIYKPLNREKCLNKHEVVYRSKLEQRLMLILDRNPNVISWGSENVVIPYKHPIKSAQSGTPQYARYYMDFYCKLKINNVVKEMLIEVKPESQTRPPGKHGNKKSSTILYENLQWSINSAKWEAAHKFCVQKNWGFLIVTEKNIDSMLA